MENMTSNKELINSIIREKMIMSLGAGVIPIPLIDILAVSAIQVGMVRQISRAFQVDYRPSEGKALITALTGASVARLGGSMIKAVPGVGSLIGGATTAILSAASTYAIGEVFKKHFETGGTFLDFDLGSLKKYYDEKFEKGKDMAKTMHKKEKSKSEKPKPEKQTTTAPKVNDSLAPRLREFAQLRDAGVLTDEEFERLKKKLLDS